MKQNTTNEISKTRETELAKRLVSDDPKERFDCMNEIEQLLSESKISPAKFRKTWKGLFMGLWNADKTKHQMEVAAKASKMVHIFESFPIETMLEWIKACFEIFHREWDGIDYNRTNKFLSLARFCLNEIYVLLQNKKYSGKLIKEWNQVFLNTVLGNGLDIKSNGLVLHILDCFVDSLVELDRPPYKVLKALLEPFVQVLSTSKDKKFSKKVVDTVFKVFLSNVEKDQPFESFETRKYAVYLLKRASSKELTEPNRKFLYMIQKEFNSHAVQKGQNKNSDANGDEQQEDEGIDVEVVKKEEKAKKNKKNKAEQNKSQEIQETKKDKKNQAKDDKGKLKEKANKKKEEKKKKNERNAKVANKSQENDDEDEDEVEGEQEWEDVEEEQDDMMEDDEEEEVQPKKGKADKGKEKKEAKAKAKAAAQNGLKRGRNQVEVEEDDDEDLEELPDDWEEELIDENEIETLNEGEDEDETDMLTDAEYMQLLQEGLLEKLPAYLFQTPKQQRAYFDKVNKEYFNKLEKAAKRQIPHSKKVNFNEKKNTIKEFDKRFKLLEDKANKGKADLANRSILKKSGTAHSAGAKKEQKKGSKKKVKI